MEIGGLLKALRAQPVGLMQLAADCITVQAEEIKAKDKRIEMLEERLKEMEAE